MPGLRGVRGLVSKLRDPLIALGLEHDPQRVAVDSARAAQTPSNGAVQGCPSGVPTAIISSSGSRYATQQRGSDGA
jgi:hypothetical protein